jgi:hypothetical protein
MWRKSRTSAELKIRGGTDFNIATIPSQTKHSAAYISHTIISHYFQALHKNCGSSAINSHQSSLDEVEICASRFDPTLQLQKYARVFILCVKAVMESSGSKPRTRVSPLSLSVTVRHFCLPTSNLSHRHIPRSLLKSEDDASREEGARPAFYGSLTRRSTGGPSTQRDATASRASQPRGVYQPGVAYTHMTFLPASDTAPSCKWCAMLPPSIMRQDRPQHWLTPRPPEGMLPPHPSSQSHRVTP